MSEETQQLATQQLKTVMSWDEMEKIAQAAAASGMFGITKKEQALCLFAICRSEGLDPIAALKRYYVIQGKPSMRSDAMAAEFLGSGGGIVWHIRTDHMAAATFFEKKGDINEAALKAANERFNLLWELDGEEDEQKIIGFNTQLANLAKPSQETIFRSYADAVAKGLTISREWDDKDKKWIEKSKHNWIQSKRQMLTARVITEGVRLVSPGLITGIYSPEEVQDFSPITQEEFNKPGYVPGETARELLKKNKLSARDRVAMEGMITQYLEDAKTASPQRASELKGLASELRIRLNEDVQEGDEIPIKNAPLEIITDDKPIERIPWRTYVLAKVRSKKLIGKALEEFSKEEIRVIAEKFVSPGLESPDREVQLEVSYILEADKELSPEQYKEPDQGPFA